MRVRPNRIIADVVITPHVVPAKDTVASVLLLFAVVSFEEMLVVVALAAVVLIRQTKYVDRPDPLSLLRRLVRVIIACHIVSSKCLFAQPDHSGRCNDATCGAHCKKESVETDFATTVANRDFPDGNR